MCRYFLIVILAVFSDGCDIMTDNDGSESGSGEVPFTSMEWLNNIISSWYGVNNKKVHDLVKNILETELNKLTPDIIEKITLENCTFGSDTPEIRGIKSRVVHLPACEGGTNQKRLVMDVAFGIDAPDFEFKLGVKIAMTFITLRAAVQKLLFNGNIRVTALFSDQVPFPGIQNLCITLTSRPQVGFNVELLEVVDIDTFGIDKMITNVLDDVLAKQLVYPGRLYVDLSRLGTGGKVTTVMMPRRDNQHPGIVSAKVQLAKINPKTKGTLKVDVSAILGEYELKETLQVPTEGRNLAILIKDFDTQEYVVKAFESRSFSKDIQYGTVKVNLADMEFALLNVTEEFLDKNKNVRVRFDVTASLLPLIAIQQVGARVRDMQWSFSGTVCGTKTPLFNTGVLYVHVHKATGVLRPGNVSLADSYVKVFYNGKEVLKTKEVGNSENPVYNQYTEFITTSFLGSELFFEIIDNDSWLSNDDSLGAALLKLSMDEKRKVNTGLKLIRKKMYSEEDTILFVSVIFRPVKL